MERFRFQPHAKIQRMEENEQKTHLGRISPLYQGKLLSRKGRNRDLMSVLIASTHDTFPLFLISPSCFFPPAVSTVFSLFNL